MRIRHRQRREEQWHLVEESPSYYLLYSYYANDKINDGSGPYAMPKADYEPVPAETWEDVTGALQMSPNHRCLGVDSGQETCGESIVSVKPGYRLVPERLCRPRKGLHLIAPNDDIWEVVDCLRVERKR